jgi:hypothetical protein
MNHCIVQYDDYTSFLIGGTNFETYMGNAVSHVYKYDWRTWSPMADMLETRLGT